MGYKEQMQAGFDAMMRAAGEDTKNHKSVKELGVVMHKYWRDAEQEFSQAAHEIPTANVQWAFAVEMSLLAKEMQRKYGIPQ